MVRRFIGETVVKLPDLNHEHRELARLLSRIDRDSRVLEVGCGTGRNLDLLRSMGFARLLGVDRNPDLITGVLARGFTCVTPEQLDDTCKEPFDLIVMSHIVEHFTHDALLGFIETYVGRLRVGGLLVVVTPLPNSVFYNDFDHVRPYLPMGFLMVFGDALAQVQYQSRVVLRLRDLRIYRCPFRLQFFRTLYMTGATSLPLWVNRALRLVFTLSGGLIGQRIGWIGLYEYAGDRGKV